MSDLSLQPILALLGQPVAGNPTQYMAEKVFAQHELDWRYLTLEVAPEDLGDAVRGIRALGFTGGNCTEPHKEAVIEYLDRTTQTAGLAGVVNVILRQQTELVGENTEGRAVVESLGKRSELAGKRIVLFGAGRIARAVAVELAAANVAEITVLNRTEAHARELVDLLAGEFELPASVVAWEDRYSVPAETDVVVNATSIGDLDAEASLPLEPESLTPRMIVADVTPDPPHTWLIREAGRRGCPTLDGLEVFVEQTAINLQLWTGIEADRDVLREAAEEFLGL